MRDRPKVGEILLEAGIIDEMQLQSALGEQARWGRRLGMTLVKLGMVQEGQLVRALARQFDMPVATLAGKKIAPEVIALVPARVAVEHSVIPLFTKKDVSRKDGPKGALFLGMEDPSDLGVLDDLAFRTGMAIRPVMVAPSELGEAIDRYYNARPAPPSPRLPDPLRGADTLSESNLRSLRDEHPPTLSALLEPAPFPKPAEPAVRVVAPADPIDATPLILPTAPPPLPEPASIAPVAPVAPVREPVHKPASLPVAAAAPAPAREAVVTVTPSPLPSPAPESPAAFAPAMAMASAMASAMAPDAGRTPPADEQRAERLAEDVARALEESERTRQVAKAIAHLLIEKGLLTLEELQARIEKTKPARPSALD